MTARRGTAIASTVLVTAFAAALATSAKAETADPAKQTRERPRGVVLDCSTQSGLGGAPGGTFRNSRNLVIGPIAMTGAGVTSGYAEGFGGNKFPLLMRGGHRVTLAVSRHTRDAKLIYGQRPASRVVTFSSCRRDQMPPRNPYEPHTACCFSFWAGGVLAPSPRCVHLLAWVDEERSPRRAVIRLGVPSCG
jgi:hypothetical protein